MLFRSPLAGKVLVRGALAYSRCHNACSSALERTRGALEVFLREALTTEEKASLAHALFGPLRDYGGLGLQPWEQRWYARDLPPAPARVLVGGCGAGRELVGLTALGYSACGFEPSAHLLQTARARLGPNAELWALTYEALLTPGAALELCARAPYDAVILGWGSFAHVLDADQRRQVLHRMQLLCPRGPLLLSVPLLSPAWRARTPGRVQVQAESLGRRVQQLRALPALAQAQQAFFPHAGFIHRFTRAELEELAHALGRSVRWGDQAGDDTGNNAGAYPHCSFHTPISRNTSST